MSNTAFERAVTKCGPRLARQCRSACGRSTRSLGIERHVSDTGITTILLAALTLANIPIYLYFARLAFGEQEDKDLSLMQWAFSFFQWDSSVRRGAGEWPALKLIAFVAICVLLVAAEYARYRDSLTSGVSE